MLGHLEAMLGLCWAILGLCWRLSGLCWAMWRLQKTRVKFYFFTRVFWGLLGPIKSPLLGTKIIAFGLVAAHLDLNLLGRGLY